MEYTNFGRTNRVVSRIGFGGATAGLKNYVHDFDPESREAQEQIIEALHRAVDLGINYFDTAAGYGDGTSEQIFGEALESVSTVQSGQGESVPIFLATKVGVWKPDEARGSMEASLKRLRRSSVDLFQIHGTVYSPAHQESIFKTDGMLDELERAKSEGLCHHIGFTVEAINETTLKLIKCGRFDTIQLAYNLIYQHPYDPYWKAGTMFDADEQNLGIAVMRTVTSGVFQKWVQTVNPQNTFDYSAALVQLVLSNPLTDVALLGMRSAARVEQNVAICNDTAGRIDISQMHGKYPTPDGKQAK